MAKKRSAELNNTIKCLYGLDIETHDPHLRDKGESWIWNEGEILVASVYHDEDDQTVLYTSQNLSALSSFPY